MSYTLLWNLICLDCGLISFSGRLHHRISARDVTVIERRARYASALTRSIDGVLHLGRTWARDYGRSAGPSGPTDRLDAVFHYRSSSVGTRLARRNPDRRKPASPNAGLQLWLSVRWRNSQRKLFRDRRQYIGMAAAGQGNQTDRSSSASQPMAQKRRHLGRAVGPSHGNRRDGCRSQRISSATKWPSAGNPKFSLPWIFNTVDRIPVSSEVHRETI